MPTTYNKFFVDTNIFVALKDISDSTHDEAQNILKKISQRKIHLVTSSHIINETLTVLSQKLGKKVSLEFLALLSRYDFEIVFITPDLHNKALIVFKKIRSKNVSFVDCTSFVVMKKEKIKYVFTFDKHFEKQGFKLLS